MKAILAIGSLALGLFLSPAMAPGQIQEKAPGRTPAGSKGNKPESQPVFFRADKVRHDKELGVVVATGNVELTQSGRILLANVVSFNRRTDMVTASGNVSLTQLSGEILFADYMKLTGDLKNGVIENLRILLADDARMAAVAGKHSGGNKTELRRGVYSPCRKCPKTKGLPPLWQIKAERVVHDKKQQTIEYFDAFLEFLGLPVAYTPYLSHPDPTVKRKSGFLTPSYGSDQELGFMLTVPYYVNIAPDKDATISPLFISNETAVFAGEYRQRFASGKITTAGSMTNGSSSDGGDDVRGHFFGESNFDIDDTWRMGSIVRFTSDDTYLRRYNFGGSSSLENRLFAEGFRGRSYAAANAYFFQGLRSDDDLSAEPLIFPMLDYNLAGEPGRQGERWNLDANLMVLTRKDGTDSRRLSLRTGWSLPSTTRWGEVYNLYATLQSDAYFVDDLVVSGRSSNDTSSSFAGRLFPKAGFDWRFPMVYRSGSVSEIIEPAVGIVLSPNGGNSDKIPNEDAKDFEFDDTNLFSPDRFTGLDRVEGGHRIYYGLKWILLGQGGGNTSAFVGQSYQPRTDTTYDSDSGLDDQFSDIVGKLLINPRDGVKIDYRFRIDKDDFSSRRNEIKASLGPPSLRLDTNYLFIDQSGGGGEFPGREEIQSTLNSQFTKEWGGRAFSTINLDNGAETRKYGFGLEYDCDCFTMTFTFTRNFTIDRDVKPTDTFLVRLNFKTLGEIETSEAK